MKFGFIEFEFPQEKLFVFQVEDLNLNMILKFICQKIFCTDVIILIPLTHLFVIFYSLLRNLGFPNWKFHLVFKFVHLFFTNSVEYQMLTSVFGQNAPFQCDFNSKFLVGKFNLVLNDSKLEWEKK